MATVWLGITMYDTAVVHRDEQHTSHGRSFSPLWASSENAALWILPNCTRYCLWKGRNSAVYCLSDAAMVWWVAASETKGHSEKSSAGTGFRPAI